jgi:c(7)-type cytochrome triheme protein
VRLITWLLLAPVLAGLLVTASLAVDGDVTLKRQDGGTSPPPAVFPHWIHRIRFKCYACHPTIFEMKAGANAITMDEIREGKFCGTCHNGKIAWEVSFDTCNRCHVER